MSVYIIITVKLTKKNLSSKSAKVDISYDVPYKDPDRFLLYVTCMNIQRFYSLSQMDLFLKKNPQSTQGISHDFSRGIWGLGHITEAQSSCLIYYTWKYTYL